MESAASSSTAKLALLVLLALFTIFYLVVFTRAVLRARRESGARVAPTPAGIATGVVTDFLDTLGIGSFATSTTIFRFWKMVPDEKIPGTLNVGHTLPTITQAFIFTTVVPVETTTLVLMIVAAVAGSWFGAGIVSGMSRRAIQLGMGGCLLAAAMLFAARAISDSTGLAIFPPGGEALGVSGMLLVIAVVGNFILGVLMCLGIGLYAPCMILVSLLGMNPIAAFPIMMGSCAFLMPVASARFTRTGSFDVKTALGIAIGGVPAAMVAGLIVKSLPLTAVRWLVVVVVLYTAWTLLLAAKRDRVVTTA